MNKTKRIIAAVLIALICIGCMGAFSGCSKASRLIGTWQLKDVKTEYITFKKGGTGEIGSLGYRDAEKIKWSVKGDKLTLRFIDDNDYDYDGSNEKITYTISKLSKNELTLRSRGETVTLVRKQSKKLDSTSRKLVGRWATESYYDYAWEFLDDGTGVMYDDYYFEYPNMVFEWKYDGKTLKLESIDYYSDGETMSISLKINGDKATAEYDGYTYELTRQK